MHFLPIIIVGFIFTTSAFAASLGDLQSNIAEMKSEIQSLKSTVEGLETKMEINIADQFADKTIASIKTNSQSEAKQFWSELLNHAKQTGKSDQVDKLLSKIVEKAYDGKRSNFYPLLEFIIKQNLVQAYPKLYDILDKHNHIFNGQEIFVLAQYLIDACGESTTELYNKLPSVVREVISGPITLKNHHNGGFILGTQHTPCASSQDCFGTPKTEAFIHRTTYSLKESDILGNTRSHWKFTPPITMDMKKGFNGTRMAWGFHLKNVAENKYLIVKTRMTTYFLRDDTSFDSYYAGDLQCQFQPHLIDGNSIELSVVEKHLGNANFVFGGDFKRRADQINIGLRQIYRDETEGFLWEVTAPEIVQGEPNVDDDVPNSNSNSDEDSKSSENLKCQF